MKTIKKEIDVMACDLCGKELNPAIRPIEITEKDSKELSGEGEKYSFHEECVNKLLIKTVKELKL